MGYGDDLLITTYAAKLKKKYPERQIVVGIAERNIAYHSPIYENNPNISDCRNLDDSKPIHIIDYHQFNRPYMDYKNSTVSKQVFREFKPVPGEIYFTKEESINGKKIISEAINFWKQKNNHHYKSIIFLETSSTKVNDSQFYFKHLNKDWGYKNWSTLVDKIKNEYLVIQIVHDKTKKIDGIFHTKKMDFRNACAILNETDFLIGPEGGFGHVAAALNKRAVLYFGGWNPPNYLGYDFHQHIYYKHPSSPCGELQKICSHCNEARESVSPDHFFEYIKKLG